MPRILKKPRLHPYHEFDPRQIPRLEAIVHSDPHRIEGKFR
jgi:hypothetical protein